MKKIMFRAKAKDTNKWVYGYFYKIWHQAYILWGMTDGVPDSTEVIPETVCQSTGKFDKNKKVIYENDTVITDDGYLEIVRWSEKDAMYLINIQEGNCDYSWLNEKCIRVVGNIFDGVSVGEMKNEENI